MKRAFAAMLLTAFLGTAGGIYFATRITAPATADRSTAIESLFTTRFVDAQGGPAPLARWREATLVVNFWATWCPPCREEMPDLSRLHEEFPEVGFVGIAVDTAANVAAFSERHPVAYPLLLHPGDAITLSRELGNDTLALPFTLVVVKGEIRWSKLGRVDASALDALLRKLAAKGA